MLGKGKYAMLVPVTELEYKKGKTVFADAGDFQFVPVASDEEALASFVREHGCRAVVLGVERYVGPLYQALPRGGIMLRFGVGTDSIDPLQAQAREITIANTPGALDRSVAEHTLFLMGALVRHIGRGNQELKAGEWTPRAGDELADLKLAVIGLGGIGLQVARMAHLAFGMETLIFRRTGPAAVASQMGIDQAELAARLGYSVWSDRTQDVLPGADVVTAHLPLTDATQGFFDAARFVQFKTGALFVNTSRGGLVVEEDLARALASGKLGGAALDVYQNEPYRPAGDGHDLRNFANVLMTPHVASNTRAANQRMATLVLDNLRHWARGELDAVHVVW
jgi:phosphoglycerate dehydrogenase-like enzyme